MLDISFHNNTVAATQFDRLAVADELDAPTDDIDKLFMRMAVTIFETTPGPRKLASTMQASLRIPPPQQRSSRDRCRWWQEAWCQTLAFPARPF